MILHMHVHIHPAGRDGHQPNGVFPAQQSGQLLQPADREQGARRGREQRGGGPSVQKTHQGNNPTGPPWFSLPRLLSLTETLCVKNVFG